MLPAVASLVMYHEPKGNCFEDTHQYLSAMCSPQSFELLVYVVPQYIYAHHSYLYEWQKTTFP